MNIAEAAIKRKVVTLVISFLFLIGGYKAYNHLGKLEDPEFTIKDALVITQYPGATPTEVEKEVSDEIEKAVQSLKQLDEVKSISKKGLSIVTVTIQDKYDKNSLPQVWDELRRKVQDAERNLPPGCKKPVVNDDYGDVYGIFLAITGDGYSKKEIKDYGDFLKRELLLVDGVGKIIVDAVIPEVVYVEISKEKLSQTGVTIEEIYQTMNSQNFVEQAGNVRVGDEYIRFEPTGEFKTVEEIGELQVKTRNSERLLKLKDIATIKRGYQEPVEFMSRFSTKKHPSEFSVLLGISVVPGGNVVKMGEGVKKRLAELETYRPVGMNLNEIYFQSDEVDKAITAFSVNLLEAVVIVILVLLVFMGMRSGVIIGAVLLLTICGTLIIMDVYSIAMERISLGALIIALGMLVDNAIVVTEGMLIKIQQGEDRLSAAKDVVAQTAMPLLGATVIAILAFAAIGVSQDSTGEFCRSLFQVMLISLMMSWVTAVTMTPLFCYMFLKAGDADDTSDPYGGVFFRVFKAVLKLLIKLRWLTVIILLAGLIASGYGFKFVKKSFFPDSTSTKFMLHIWLPEGTDIRATSDVVKDIEKKVSSDDRVKTIATFIGKGAPRFMLTFTPEKSYSSYALLLIDAKDYNQIDKLAADLRKDIDIKYPNILTQVKKIMIGPGDGSKVEARFDGPDPDVLRVLAEKTKAIMRADADATGIRDDWRERVKVIKPIYDENKARLVGVYRPQLCEATKVAFDGKQIGLYREGEDLLPIISRAPESERESVNNLYEVLVWSPLSQRVINITQVVSGFDTTWEDAIIQRYNRKRTITAMCDPDKGMASDLFARLKPQIEAIELPAGYHLEWGGEYENSTKAQKGLTKNLPVSFLLMVLIIIMLFNSLKQPAVILLTVPLAVIGVTTGLLVTGEAFGFMALLGFLSLSGMLIKNAIVLIDEINLLRSQDVPPYKAVIDATISRVRPVSMAAATTILGMIPLVTDAFFSSMAVTIMFGLAFATCLTLLVVPVLYAIFYKVESTDEV